MFDTPEATPVRTRRLARSERAVSGTASAVTLSASETVPVAALALRRDRMRGESVAPLTRRAARQAVAAEPMAAAETPAHAPAPAAPVASSREEESAASAARDLFAEARRVFSTAEVPVSDVADVDDQKSDAADAAPRHRTHRRRGGKRRLAAVGSTVLVMGVTSLIAVSMTLPSGAVAAAQGAHSFSTVSLALEDSEAVVITPDQIQAFVAPEDVETEVLERTAADLSTVTFAELAAEQGIKYSDSLYTNDANAAIQWPFVVGVAMSSPYGPRRGAMHQGIDLVPGNGAPVQAIADGVVRVASESGGGYGVHVWIDHVIDGELISSHYAHMQHGSLEVVAGQKVAVGDILGKTGNTGRSYGAHLHFEITVNGTIVNPLPWMRENTGRYEY